VSQINLRRATRRDWLTAWENEPYNYATPRDYQVSDISMPSEPVVLADDSRSSTSGERRCRYNNIPARQRRLTVVRLTSIDDDYKAHLMQMLSN
jgi:hypothetical protein